jgi:antitoxin component YwqK of YwqJK toxin-antitoxin module
MNNLNTKILLLLFFTSINVVGQDYVEKYQRKKHLLDELMQFSYTPAKVTVNTPFEITITIKGTHSYFKGFPISGAIQNEGTRSVYSDRNLQILDGPNVEKKDSETTYKYIAILKKLGSKWHNGNRVSLDDPYERFIFEIGFSATTLNEMPNDKSQRIKRWGMEWVESICGPGGYSISNKYSSWGARPTYHIYMNQEDSVKYKRNKILSENAVPNSLQIKNTQAFKQDEIMLHKKTMEPFTGTIYWDYTVTSWGNTTNTDRIHSIQNYKSGKLKTIKRFDYDGNLEEITTINDLKTDYTSYYINGNIKENYSIINNSQKYDGELKRYFYNGQIKDIENYRYGKNNGKFISYNHRGQKTKEVNYYLDLKDEKWEEWEDNFHCFYERGCSEITWFEEEKQELHKKYEMNYDRGLRDGIQKGWYSNGNKKHEMNYDRGSLEGLQKRWYTNGGIKLEENYLDGQLHGKQILYFKNQSVWVIENYTNGKKDGVFKYYHGWKCDGYPIYWKGPKRSEAYYLPDEWRSFYTDRVYLEGLKQKHNIHEKKINQFTQRLDTLYSKIDIKKDEIFNLNIKYDSVFRIVESNQKTLNSLIKDIGEKRFYKLRTREKEKKRIKEKYILTLNKYDKTDSILEVKRNISYEIEKEIERKNKEKEILENNIHTVISDKQLQKKLVEILNDSITIEESKKDYESNLFINQNWIDGVKNGKQQIYNCSNILVEEENYENGLLDGIQKGWHNNGNKKYEKKYITYVEHGTQKEWHENGIQENEENYINGLEHGIQQGWYSSGEKRYMANYNNGKLDGTQKYWYSSGQIQYEKTYNDGDLSGVQKFWFEDGQIKHEVNYKNGKLDGAVKKYTSSGEAIYEVNFRNNMLNGKCTWWSKSGMCIAKAKFKNSKIDSILTIWTENKNNLLKTEFNYDEGKFNYRKCWNGTNLYNCPQVAVDKNIFTHKTINITPYFPELTGKEEAITDYRNNDIKLFEYNEEKRFTTSIQTRSWRDPYKISGIVINKHLYAESTSPKDDACEECSFYLEKNYKEGFDRFWIHFLHENRIGQIKKTYTWEKVEDIPILEKYIETPQEDFRKNVIPW